MSVNTIQKKQKMQILIKRIILKTLLLICITGCNKYSISGQWKVDSVIFSASVDYNFIEDPKVIEKRLKRPFPENIKDGTIFTFMNVDEGMYLPQSLGPLNNIPS